MQQSRRLLLLVEDNADDEEMTLRALRKANLECCACETVRDGQEALDWLSGEGRYAGRDTSQQPDLIILDLGLPRVPGLDVLQRIRTDQRLALTPVVILTSSLEQKDRLRSYLSGANSYVQKPVDAGRFSEAVQQLGVYWTSVNERA